MFKEERFEDVLKSLRVRQGKMWTQARMAQSLGISERTYIRWENGDGLPQSRDLKNIAAILRLSDTDSETLFRAAGSQAPKMQNVPFPPNPFFTGRENELLQISRLFEKNERIAISQPISVSGLGGIGKTQLALEYAHRSYPDVYHSVFFVNAADRASLAASYLTLSQLLQLPEQNEREVERIVQAVKVWLEEHTHWLLILDNADDLELARSYLPTKPRGHILLTTRSQIVGDIATLIQVETLSPEEGLLFLLRRSGVLPSGTELDGIAADIRQAAGEVVAMLAGHPLALDQAGAYIEETSDPETRASSAAFSEYRQLYQEQRRLLLQRRGELGDEHPDSIALTFEISVQKACERHPKCAEVLAFCSLLHPDAIPEELLHQGLSLDVLHLNEVIRALRSYSLIKRNVEKQVISLHRLVQAVIRDGMERQTVQRWTECVVQVMNDVFPEVTFEEWAQCERYLPHALVCANWIEQEVVTLLPSAQLFEKAGAYLRHRGQYSRAEPLLVQALALCEQHLGVEHPDTAKSLNSLGNLYLQQGKYESAEPLYERALAVREQHLGSEHPRTAESLYSLANLYLQQGKYEQVEPLFQQALAIREQHLGSEHLRTAESLYSLANLYLQQGKYESAEPLYQRVLAIREQQLGPEHPDTAKSLNNLGITYYKQGEYEQAESLYQQALAIWNRYLGPKHHTTAICLDNLAELYRYQGKYE